MMSYFLTLQISVVLPLLCSAIAATGASFVLHATARQKSTSHRHFSQELAAKKKKGKQRTRQSPKASGTGFGQKKPPTAALPEVVVEGPPVSSSVHADLITWLKENPNTFISPKFCIERSGLGGYGGFANSPIQENELLLRIPRECCVTYEDALFDPESGEEFQLIKQQRVPSWGMVLIAGWIAKEYLLANEYATTKHLPYFKSIPWTQEPGLGQDHVLFWSDKEVETLLGGSLAYEDALLIRKTVDSTVKLLTDFVVPIIHEATKNESNEADVLEKLEQTVKGAFVIALSRSFAEEVESDDGAIEIENLLLPVIDILQHSNTPNTILEPYEDYILLRARCAVKKGEEFFHQYQEENDDVIPPHKFFTRYGFVPGLQEPIIEVLKAKSNIFF